MAAAGRLVGFGVGPAGWLRTTAVTVAPGFVPAGAVCGCAVGAAAGGAGLAAGASAAGVGLGSAGFCASSACWIASSMLAPAGLPLEPTSVTVRAGR